MSEKLADSGLKSWLDRAWRLFGTALSFTVFGIGGLIMGLLVFPLFFVFVWDKSRRQVIARNLVSRCFQAFIWMTTSLGVISYEVVGRAHIKDVSRTLIIANHPTLIDVVFLVSFFRQSECVIKRAVTRNPFMGFVTSAANYVSNSDPELMLDECAARLRDGSSLVLFPEGTRRPQTSPLEFKMGAATIAVRGKARIMPVVIDCQPPTLGKNHPWHYVPPTRPHWRFEFRPPMELEEFITPGENQRANARALQSAWLNFYEENVPGDRQGHEHN